MRVHTVHVHGRSRAKARRLHARLHLSCLLPRYRRRQRERWRPGEEHLVGGLLLLLREPEEREPLLLPLARGRVLRVLAQVVGEAVGELLGVVARRERAASLESSEKRVGRGPREPWVA